MLLFAAAQRSSVFRDLSANGYT